ncbi:MAG TPA: bifunctional diguanylate cyclase/phosphodiesterase, partial [Gallionella sp.]|nr:bifunctional diguanylate cyclase/phosphodiesterase [Gallionella sp.]
LLRGIFALLGIALMWLLRRSYLELRSALGGRLEQVQSHFAQLGKGDFATPIAVPQGSEESVLGWLAQTQSKLKALQQDNDSAHAKLQRITQLYAALSQCNQAIVRSRDEAELFAIICRDAVNFGGMKMAWIGLLEESGQWVKQVASFGAGIAYLEGLEISLDAESPKGLGPTATAMREDHPFWCQDFQHDPATAAWHERGARFGWAASAALPLHRKGHVIGAFSLYTDVAHAFDEEAQHLLVEMAMDIDFALDHFVDEAQRAVAQQALQEAEEVYRAAFQSSPDTININRLEDGLYLDVNAAFERVSGWTRDEVIGRTSAEINIWHDMADRSRLLEHLQRDGGCENMKAQFAMKDGTLRTCLMSARKITLKGVACILSITRDMSAQEQADARIQQLAHFDQLTGLPNRALLNDRFKYSLSLAQRSGEPLVVMFLDLDHFKTINDTLGHSIGDQLLMEVSRRLKSSLREEDTLSRMGGDEFILVLPGTDEAGARQVAGKLIEAVAHPCQIEQYELVNTISIGIALYPHDGEDFETLSKHADTAMYRVKQASRNDFCFFTQEMQAHSARTLQLLNALRHALARNELALYYQPQIALQDGHIIGAEALLRWTHPELGSISPDEFIPIAEDSGLIIPIGEWVLRSAATQARAWLASGLPPLVVAVNLSAVQFRHPNLTELVNRILAETQLAAEYLELELTEAVAMDDPLAAIAVMNKLHECGIRMSIDDFGTGYSSLSYLKKFQVYKLKIDQSFVRDITDDPDDKAIVSAIINLANSLGMQTIAEGVETSGQLAFLRLQGCDEVQGYYFSKPLPAGEFEQFVKASLSTAAV